MPEAEVASFPPLHLSCMDEAETPTPLFCRCIARLALSFADRFLDLYWTMRGPIMWFGVTCGAATDADSCWTGGLCAARRRRKSIGRSKEGWITR